MTTPTPNQIPPPNTTTPSSPPLQTHHPENKSDNNKTSDSIPPNQEEENTPTTLTTATTFSTKPSTKHINCLHDNCAGPSYSQSHNHTPSWFSSRPDPRPGPLISAWGSSFDTDFEFDADAETDVGSEGDIGSSIVGSLSSSSLDLWRRGGGFLDEEREEEDEGVLWLKGKGKGKEKEKVRSSKVREKKWKGKQRGDVQDTADEKTKAYIQGYEDAISDARHAAWGANSRRRELVRHESNVSACCLADQCLDSYPKQASLATIAERNASFGRYQQYLTRRRELEEGDEARSRLIQPHPSPEEDELKSKEILENSARYLEQRIRDIGESPDEPNPFPSTEDRLFETAVRVVLAIEAGYQLSGGNPFLPTTQQEISAVEAVQELVARPCGFAHLVRILGKIKRRCLLRQPNTPYLLHPHPTKPIGVGSLPYPSVGGLDGIHNLAQLDRLLTEHSSSRGSIGILTRFSNLLYPNEPLKANRLGSVGALPSFGQTSLGSLSGILNSRFNQPDSLIFDSRFLGNDWERRYPLGYPYS